MIGKKMKRGKWTAINAGNRRTPGAMNQTEQAFEREQLAPRQAAGEIDSWAFEPITIRLGKRCSYSPDFVVLRTDGTVEVWEVKGTAGWSLDSESRTKWKAAAESWLGGMFVFRAATKRRKKDGGGWKTETYERVNSWPGGDVD
jgi:hypothetical protein